MYKRQAQGGAGANAGAAGGAYSAGPDMGGQTGPADDNVVDADYEVVDDDK